jgi:hypothetical protein
MRTLIILLLLLVSVSEAQVQWNATLTNTGGTTIYDLGSNSSPQWIAQDPNTPANIHAVIMSAPLGDPNTYPTRRTKYYFSTNGGVTWDFVANLNDRKSGFPSINVASDGCAYICNYGSTTTNTSTHTVVYGDVFPGLGAFTVFEPPASSGNYFFAKFCMTSSLVLSTKFIMMGQSFTSDSTFRTTGPSPWGSWTPFTRSTPETYTAARGTDGRIGIVYMQTGTTTTDYRNIYFIQSTDNGTTFSAPINIYQAKFEGAGADSLAAFRGLSLAYKGNVPCATFETVKQDPTSGSYDMTAPAKIMFWSQELPGADPFRSITIASKTNVLIPSPDSIKTGVNDQLGSLSRPAIGVSSDNNTIIVVFQAFTNKWGGSTDTTNFKALYVTKATGNYNFSKPYKFTPDAPLMDWSYPSISSWNSVTSQNIFANVCALRDSIPGTYVNSNANGQSIAALYYIKLSTSHTIGINNNETALSFTLEQNYPNPFNPVTNIKYQIPKDGFVKLAVYDMLGREVEVLINEKQSTGAYETSWNASRFSSGVYFYKLTAGNFVETKRMLLIK